MTQEKLRDYMLTFADTEEYNPFDDAGPIYRHKSNGKWFGFFAELAGNRKGRHRDRAIGALGLRSMRGLRVISPIQRLNA